MTEGYFQDRIYFRRNEFTARRPSLVFMHGLSGSLSAWRFYEDRFGANYNLLFFDLRGHGKSIKKKTFDYYAPANTVEDINGLAKNFGLGKFGLASHSFSTLPALEFARKYPEKVESLILLAPDYRIAQTARAKMAWPFLTLSEINNFLPFEERTGVHIDYSKFMNTGDWNLRRLFADISNTSWRVYCHCLRQARKTDGRKLIQGLDLPVLIVHGKKDTVFPYRDSEKLAEKIPGARLKILSAANHILVINNHEEVGDEIEKFAGEHNRAEGLVAKDSAV